MLRSHNMDEHQTAAEANDAALRAAGYDIDAEDFCYLCLGHHEYPGQECQVANSLIIAEHLRDNK
jgi:hypothetical protein